MSQTKNDQVEERRRGGRLRVFVYDKFLKYLFDPRRVLHRYFVHFLLCLVCPGSIFHETVFASFETRLLYWFEINHKEFSLLFSLPILIGIITGPAASLVLKFGATRMICVIAIILFLMAVLIGLSVGMKSFACLLIFRSFFSPCVSLLSAIATLVTFRLFSTGVSRSIACSFLIFFNRLGAISGFYFSENILSISSTTSDAVWISLVPVFVCVIFAISFAYFYGGTRIASIIRPLMENIGTGDVEIVYGERINFHFIFSLLKQLPRAYWVLWFLIGCFYGVIVPFETVAVNFFQESFSSSVDNPAKVLSLCPLIALFSPVFGFFICTPSRQLASVVLASCLVSISMFGVYLQVNLSPSVFMIVLGTGYMAATNTVWILIPYFACPSRFKNSGNSRYETLAVGAASASHSLFVSLGNLISGLLRDFFQSYDEVLLFFSLVSLVGLFCSIYLLVTGLGGERNFGYNNGGETEALLESSEVKVRVFSDKNHGIREGLNIDFYS